MKTSKTLVHLFLAAAAFLTSATVPAATHNDTPEELRAKVDELYARLSLEERVAQICAATVGTLTGKDGKFDAAKAKKRFPHGIGHVCQFACNRTSSAGETRDFVKALQKWAIEETSSGIPAICHEEVISGLAAHTATTYPQQIGIACSFDPALLREKCDETALAGRMLGATFALSPMADVVYNSKWTRGEEGYGESGYLAAVMGTAFVEGLQRNPGGHGIMRGMGACAKHFLGYGVIGGGSSRDWKDIYEEVVYPHEAMIRKGDSAAVMTSYDQFKGVQAVSNPFLIGHILRDYIGFNGAVVSDYSSVTWGTDSVKGDGKDELLKKRAVEAIRAGNDIDLPHGAAYFKLVDMVKNGEISEKEIEPAVKNSLMLKARLGLLRCVRSKKIKSIEHLPLDHDMWMEGELDLDRPEWRATARKLAGESIVLLKNDGILPLAKSDGCGKVALVGPNANSDWAMLGDYTYQCMQAFWRRNPQKWDEPHIVTLKEGLEARLRGLGMVMEYARGVEWCSGADVGVSAGGDPRTEGLRLKMAAVSDETDFDSAVAMAAANDIIIAAMGENFTLCGESRQRASIRMAGRQEEFVRALVATGKKVVLVLFGGRNEVLPDDIVDGCSAIIQAWYPGEEGGNAVADIITGAENPSGRLAMTYPRVESDEDMTFGDSSDTPDRARWPFGWGLSYTSFEYEKAETNITADISADGFVTFDFNLKNTGGRDGTEVVQAYLRLGRKRLRAFGRIDVASGGRERVRVRIPLESFAQWEGEEKGEWVLRAGEYAVDVGPNAWEAPVKAVVRLEGDEWRFKVRNIFFGSVTRLAAGKESCSRRQIVFGPGVHRSAPIRLESNEEIYLEEGAELVIDDDLSLYPVVPTSWEGTHVMGYQPLVYAYGATNVAIRGKGVIRPELGLWNKWGELRKKNPSHAKAKSIQVDGWNAAAVPLAERDWAHLAGSLDRPQLIEFYGCDGVTLEDFRIHGSPFWCIHLLESENCNVRGVNVFADGHNTDGIDIESSKNVLVEDCVFNQGDDAVVIKSGLNRDGRDTAKPSENITIRRCVINEGHGMLSIGSELSGGIRNVLLEDCRADATIDKLFFIKSNPSRGGYVENIVFRNVKACAVRYDAFAVITNYFWKPEEYVGEETFATAVSNLTVENVYVASCKKVYNLTGYKGNEIRNVKISNLRVAAPREASSAVFIEGLEVE